MPAPNCRFALVKMVVDLPVLSVSATLTSDKSNMASWSLAVLVSRTTTFVFPTGGGGPAMCEPEPQPVSATPKMAMAKDEDKRLNAFRGSTDRLYGFTARPPFRDSRSFAWEKLKGTTQLQPVALEAYKL
jgi:hypothetical protein